MHTLNMVGGYVAAVSEAADASDYGNARCIRTTAGTAGRKSMNAEQKKRANELLSAWRATAYALHGDAMAALLQELVDAPEVEPVAATTLLQTAPKAIYLNISDEGDGSKPFPESWHGDEVGWSEEPALAENVKYVRADLAAPSMPRLNISLEFDDLEEPVEIEVFGTERSLLRLSARIEYWAILEKRHEAPSVPDGWRPFLTDVITAAGLLEHGKRDKGLAGRIGKFAFDAMCAAPAEPESHPDDIAVDKFAEAMKAKMARSRDCGRYGWDDPAVCTADDLRLFLTNHIAKGDPVDVGNFAMMLFNRGESTKPEPPAGVAQWIDPNDKTQKQFLPHIGERVLFCHAGKTYYGKHTGGSFISFTNPGNNYPTWDCHWMYPPKAIDAARERQWGES